jgi:hypothetical protein
VVAGHPRPVDVGFAVGLAVGPLVDGALEPAYCTGKFSLFLGRFGRGDPADQRFTGRGVLLLAQRLRNLVG